MSAAWPEARLLRKTFHLGQYTSFLIGLKSGVNDPNTTDGVVKG